MQALSRDYVRYAAAALVICAGIGLYLGLTRAISAPGGTGVSEAFGERVPSAKPIAAPPPATLDESAVRRIAREEAQALLAKPAVAAAPRKPAVATTPSAPRLTTPSDAGIVYARPPKPVDTGGPLTPATPPQLDQY